MKPQTIRNQFTMPKRKRPAWTKWPLMAIGVLAVIVIGVSSAKNYSERQEKEELDEQRLEAKSKLDDDLKHEVRLQVKKLRTTARQLEREPSAYTAKIDLDSFLSKALWKLESLKKQEVTSRYTVCFQIMHENLDSFKRVHQNELTANDVIEAFEDVADKVEAKYESLAESAM